MDFETLKHFFVFTFSKVGELTEHDSLVWHLNSLWIQTLNTIANFCSFQSRCIGYIERDSKLYFPRCHSCRYFCCWHWFRTLVFFSITFKCHTFSNFGYFFETQKFDWKCRFFEIIVSKFNFFPLVSKRPVHHSVLSNYFCTLSMMLVKTSTTLTIVFLKSAQLNLKFCSPTSDIVNVLSFRLMSLTLHLQNCVSQVWTTVFGFRCLLCRKPIYDSSFQSPFVLTWLNHNGSNLLLPKAYSCTCVLVPTLKAAIDKTFRLSSYFLFKKEKNDSSNSGQERAKKLKKRNCK